MALEPGISLVSHADYLTLPDEPRGEVLEGVFVVTPAPYPRHQHLADELLFELKRWLREHPGAGRVFSAPLDVVLRADRPAVVVQPDVLFVAAGRDVLTDLALVGAPDLVIEVVSTSSASRDAITKRDLYERFGVREYWLVWPVESRVDVLAADGEGGSFAPVRTLGPEDVLGTPLMPGLAIPLADLWGPAESTV